ncbi:MAG: glycosyl hydrolase [Deltaproteobacteria bacterium]|nr:glycosyl hydrolase [Deltaproteobacteria bacterium]
MANEKEEMGLDRRGFLKAAGLAGVGLAGCLAGSLSGCATAETPKPDIAASLSAIKTEPVVYPQLPYNKVSAPKEGCLVGLYKERQSGIDPVAAAKNKEMLAKAKNIDEYADMLRKENFFDSTDKETPIGNNITHYEKSLSAKPFIFVLGDTPRLYSGFPTRESKRLAKSGIVPYINARPGSHVMTHLRFTLEELARGKRDNYIKEFAKSAAEFGKEHGGFFMTTMEESNGNWYYWGQNRDFVPAWRNIWQIFEDQGANQYATWVWETYCVEANPSNVRDPEQFYPGDKYVDWIGLSAFAKRKYPTTDGPFDSQISKTCERMRKLSPQKPIMQAEFGKTNAYDQPKWLNDAYKSIKQDFPAIKAAIQWDNVSPDGDDHTLSPKSLQAMKEIFKDPYWIMAK